MIFLYNDLPIDDLPVADPSVGYLPVKDLPVDNPCFFFRGGGASKY